MAIYYDPYYYSNFQSQSDVSLRTMEILAASKARSEEFDKEFERRLSVIDDKLRRLQTANRRVVTTPSEVSLFNGDGVDQWLNQIEGFFIRYQVIPEQKLAVADHYLNGEALEWYQQWHREMWWCSYRAATWEEFVRDLKIRFKPPEIQTSHMETDDSFWTRLEELKQMVREMKSDHLASVAELSSKRNFFSPIKSFFNPVVESVGSASAEIDLASIDVTDKSDSAIATGVFEDGDLDVSTIDSTQTEGYLPPVYVARSNDDDQVSLDLVLLSESGKEDFGLEVDLHSDSKKSAVIGGADMEVTSDKFSVDDSYAFLWSKDDLGKCEEHDDLNEEIRSEASLDDLISNFSFRVSGVCRNASMNRPTHFTMHMDLSSRLNNILPPAKPPDDDVSHDVVTWNIHLDRSLQQFEIKRCTQEQAVYTTKGKEGDIIIGVYVDDLIVTGESLLMVGKFKEQLTKEFEMNDLGKLSYYLGIEVKQSAERITLKQSSYEWSWRMMSLRVNREVSGSNHPPHSDFNVAVGMARDGAAVTHHGVELELVVSSENNSCGAFSAGNGDHIETASGYGKMFSAICPTSITRARSMQPFPRFSMGIFVCIGVVQFSHLRSYVATPEPPTEAHDSVAFAKHELCYSYELFYAILIHALDMNEKLYEALLFSPRPTLTPLTYNAWIGACAGNDDLEKSLDVMSRMRRHGFQPDFVNFSLIIQSFTRANTVDSVVWQKLCSEIESDLEECNVHENKPHLELGVAGSITKHGFVVKMYVVNLIIKTLLQNGEISKATDLFRRAGMNGLAVDVVSYDTIMMGFVKNGRVKSALDMFSLMVEKGSEPTLLTYDSLIDGFCREGVMQDALTWLARMRESGLKPDAVMYNALMKCLCDNQEVGGAMKLLSFMLKDVDGVEANRKAFRILIHGRCKEGCLKETIVVHDQMVARGLSADLMSYNQLIDGFFKVGNIKKGKEFWKQMVDLGFVPDPITYSTTTVLFFKEDHLEYFEEIKEEYAEFYTSLSNACKEHRGMKHFSTKVVLSQVNMTGEEYVTFKEMKLSETVLLQLYFSLDELVSLMCSISKIFLFSLPRPPEMDVRWNEVVANLACLMRFYNKIFMFSVPRPPEIIDLEDKVKFKGEGMLRIRILRKLRGQVVFCA